MAPFELGSVFQNNVAREVCLGTPSGKETESRSHPDKQVSNTSRLKKRMIGHLFGRKQERCSWAVFVVVVFLRLLCTACNAVEPPQCAASNSNHHNGNNECSAVPEKYNRLVEAFPVGGKVTVANIGGQKVNSTNYYGLIAKTAIQKGEVILTTDQTFDAIFAEKLRMKHVNLYEMINDIRDDDTMDFPPTTDHVVMVLVLLHEIRLGDQSRFAPYVRALPKTDAAFGGAYFWTQEEIQNCVVPRPSEPATVLRQQLRNLIRIVEKLSRSSMASATIDNDKTNKDDLHLIPRIQEGSKNRKQRQELAWAYVMVRTRAFDYGTGPRMLPMLDMANHDPTRAMTIFAHNQYVSFVAVKDIAAGEEVFNRYTNMCSCGTAEKYGFVDDAMPFVNAPSIKADIVAMTLSSSPNDNDDGTADLLSFCRQKAMLFYGNVTEQRLEASWADMTQTTYMKPFRPTHTTYKCIQLLLRNKNQEQGGSSTTTMARYLVSKLKEDLNKYEEATMSKICNSQDGNYPLILRANRLQVQGLREALEVAKKAAAGHIEYPGIPYP